MSSLFTPGLPWRPQDSQVGRLGGAMDSEYGSRDRTRNFLYPEFQSLVSDPGYSEGEKSGIMQESLGAAENTFGAYRDRAANRVARTGNSAGYGSLVSELGREEGRTKGSITRQNMVGFADEKFKRKMAGMEGLMRMYGIDTSFLNSLFGQATGIENIRESGRQSRKLGARDWIELAKSAAAGAMGGG